MKNILYTYISHSYNPYFAAFFAVNLASMRSFISYFRLFWLNWWTAFPNRSGGMPAGNNKIASPVSVTAKAEGTFVPDLPNFFATFL